MQREGLERYAPLAGVVFVALVMPVFFLGGTQPDPDEKLAKVLDFWNVAHRRVVRLGWLGGPCDRDR